MLSNITALSGGAGTPRKALAASTRRSYQRRLDHDLSAIMTLAPTNGHGRRLRKRYGKVRNHLFTFLEHPEVPPDNNGSERDLRPTATYRKVTGEFRSNWGADFFAAARSITGIAARRGIGAYQGIRTVPGGDSVIQPGSADTSNVMRKLLFNQVSRQIWFLYPGDLRS
jgi:transposase